MPVVAVTCNCERKRAWLQFLADECSQKNGPCVAGHFEAFNAKGAERVRACALGSFRCLMHFALRDLFVGAFGGFMRGVFFA